MVQIPNPNRIPAHGRMSAEARHSGIRGGQVYGLMVEESFRLMKARFDDPTLVPQPRFVTINW